MSDDAALKLVPVGPTDEMIEAAYKEIRRCPDGTTPSPARLWQIMLAAAPSYEHTDAREQLVIEIAARMVAHLAVEMRRRREDGDEQEDGGDAQEENPDWRLMSNGGRYYAGRGLAVVDLPGATSYADAERLFAEWRKKHEPD